MPYGKQPSPCAPPGLNRTMRRPSPAVDCPVCSSTDFRIRYEGLGGVDGNRYDFITCRECGFGTVSPMLSDDALTDFYTASHASRTKINIYEHADAEDFIKTNQSVIEDNLTLLSLVEPYRTPEQTRFLDVGCGHGFMCFAAKLSGLDAVGVDLDADAKRIGARHLGVEITTGTIADVARRDFDVITEIMTLEHVRDLRRHVVEVKDRLDEGGLYVGSVPNVRGFFARLRGRNWYHLIPPEHLNYFSEQTLGRFLRSAGFDVLYLGTIPLYAAPTICFGVRSRLNGLIAKQRNALIKRALTALYRVLTLIKRYALYKPLNFLILTLKLPGNGIFWVARKSSNATAVLPYEKA